MATEEGGIEGMGTAATDQSEGVMAETG